MLTDPAVHARNARRVMALVLTMVMVGCTSTARVTHFRQFAESGDQFVQAIDHVLDEAGTAAIDADSAGMLAARDLMVQGAGGQIDNALSKQLRDEIVAANDDLQAYLNTLNDIRRHSLLLRSYFQALAALAESDGPSAIGSAAGELARSLEETSGRLLTSVGNMATDDFVENITRLVVNDSRRRALDEELRQRGPTIDRELQVLGWAIDVITESMESDLRAMLNRRGVDEVIDPFTSGSVPSSWAKRRREHLMSKAATSKTAAAASQAAASLRLTFVALVEGRETSTDITLLLRDINELVALAETISGTDAS